MRFGALMLLAGCSLVQDPDMFDFVDDGGVDAGDVGTGCTRDDDCPARPNAVVGCELGECVVTACADGFDDCNGNAADGCEVELAVDVAHCGACERACELPNASPQCVDGICQIESCLDGFADCNTDRGDGCEQDLLDPSVCGCTATCPPEAMICDRVDLPPECVEGCESGTLCGTDCVDLDADPLHCTECDMRCPDRENATPTCDSGCGFECLASFGDCNGAEGDGCEVDTRSDAAHCGACGDPCVGMNALWECIDSACAVDDCDAGFGDCNGDPSDGCEQDLLADSALHCGSCGSPCSNCVVGVCNPVIAFDGDERHTCAARADGTLLCWGFNSRGQIGVGTRTPAPAPTEVSALSDVTDVAVGSNHTCAISAGELFCWGQGSVFELGTGTSISFFSPEPVVSSDPTFGDRTFIRVSAAETTTCAIDELSRLWCWGRNLFGEAGTGDQVGASRAERVVSLDVDVVDVQSGQLTTCALLGDATVRCFGRDNVGQAAGGIVAGSRPPILIPRDVGLIDVRALAVGEAHACAVVGASGELWCWGQNHRNQMGTLAAGNYFEPTQVPGLSGVTEVSAGDSFTCIRDALGVGCFGNRDRGQLGDVVAAGGDAGPVRPAGTSSVTGVRSFTHHSCGIDGTGMVCWGDNTFGQLGRENTIAASTPVALPVADVSAITPGAAHTCGIIAGAPHCWGQGGDRATGLGSLTSVATPTPIAGGLSTASTIDSGTFGSCAISGGQAYCWGTDTDQRLGIDGGSTETPTILNLAGSEDEISAGHTHGCARQGGNVFCWGRNSNGQLGRGTTGSPEATPASVIPPFVDAVEVGAARHFTCARHSGGSLSCWGLGGNLGDGTTTQSAVAVNVTGLSNAIDLDVGGFHACAIEEGATPGQGQVFCWGDNTTRAVGHPSLDSLPSPHPVLGVTDAVSVTAGNRHSCAVRADGSVVCWGDNEAHQLGDGTSASRSAAMPVSGIANAISVHSGLVDGDLTCALLSDDTATCWGICAQGACGTGEELFRPNVAAVVGL